jgi:hypothetical protein
LPAPRLASCRVAGFLSPSPELLSDLRACAEYHDPDVATAALAATEQLRRASLTDELVTALQNESDVTHGWTLLDALISSADPGEAGTPPAWMAAVGPYLTAAMARYANEQLKERRKRLKQELERLDRHKNR